ncbi:MAG: tRNA-specific adenosine deaminase [Alphaproteobacteria bacterium]|nr:MAG: tRNA-specific adenosine deaminase [Alphaproteobacteria bacterium]
MREAIALSAQNMKDNTGGPFGAVVVKDGKIVGRGSNKVTSSNDPTAHAEVVAIRDACRNLDDFSLAGCEIYTSCEPCPMCLSAIYWARLDKVYFANTQHDAAEIDFDDRFLYEQVALPKEGRSLPSVPLLRDEALQVFKEWQAKTDKIPY